MVTWWSYIVTYSHVITAFKVEAMAWKQLQMKPYVMLQTFLLHPVISTYAIV